MPFCQDDSATYYLRNSFTQNYLFASGSSVAIGSKKDDAFYRWRFVKHANTSNCYLQNVGNNQYFNVVQLNGGSYNGYYTISMSTTTHTLAVSGNSVFKMGISGGSTYCISDCGGTIYAVNASYWPGQNQPGRDEWHFEDIHRFPLINKNPLPRGTYRIRSFNGSYLLTMPQGDVGNPYVSQQDQNNDFQKWLLVPEGDSLYTIRNAGTGLYLAGGSSAKLVKGARPIGQSVAGPGETPFQWKIETFGPGVMFFIGLSDDRLSIGFPKYIAEDLSQVALQPSDNIPSQMWFFETFEPLSPATFHATRQLISGTYILESCHSKQYLCVSTDDFVVATSDHTKATKFNLEFVADYSPNFTLSYADVSYGTFYLSVEKNRLVTSDEDEKSTWVLLPREYQGVGTVYFICDSTVTEPRRVISCRKVKDRKRSYFALDPLIEGESMQLWNFREAVEARGPPSKDGSF